VSAWYGLAEGRWFRDESHYMWQASKDSLRRDAPRYVLHVLLVRLIKRCTSRGWVLELFLALEAGFYVMRDCGGLKPLIYVWSLPVLCWLACRACKSVIPAWLISSLFLFDRHLPWPVLGDGVRFLMGEEDGQH